MIRFRRINIARFLTGINDEQRKQAPQNAQVFEVPAEFAETCINDPEMLNYKFHRLLPSVSDKKQRFFQNTLQDKMQHQSISDH